MCAAAQDGASSNHSSETGMQQSLLHGTQALRMHAVRLLRRQLLLVAELSVLLANRRRSAGVRTGASARLTAMWERSQELQPGLFVLSTCHSAVAFEQVRV